MEELVESILDYVRSDYTDYAIMINGEWGSGKTYFWNNKIRNKIESMNLNGKSYTTIYMSLYGISNLEEISKKIFIETTQLMDKNLKKYMQSKGQVNIPEYAKTGLDMANLFGVTQNGDKVDYANFFSTEDKVLCFDDLERANVDVIDILGYINNFVEHDHIKTIIICNEKELATKLKSNNLEMKTFIATYLLDKEGNLVNKSDKPMVEKIQDTIEHVFDKANDYERIKEKLIGETFEYAPKFNYIINGILMRYEKDKELIRFLRENTNLIVSTFNKSGTRNLRILKHALNDFKKIFDMVSKSYPNTNYRVLQTMLIFTIAVSFEIKAGKVTKDKFINIENNEEYKAILVSSRIFLDNRQFYIKEFDNNYYYNFKSEYRFFKFIEMYVRTRIFDMKTFKENMEVIINTIDTDKLPGYKRLLTDEYWKIPDDQFCKVIEEVIEGVKNGEFKLIDTVKLFAYFSYFVKKKLIQYDMKTIKSVFLNGMNIASLNSEYCDNVDEELRSILIEDIGLDMDEILRHFYTINNSLRDKKYSEVANQVFKNIPIKMEIFYDKFDKECMEIPIFKYTDAYQMFQRISCANNEDIMIIKEKMIDRAKRFKEQIKDEIGSIKKIKQVVDDYIEGKEITIKIVMLEEFSKGLAEIIEIYNS
ncbi:MAG: P-loop NTPase fold protein [Clostridia bacterium]|nr:P-loop NTPase fold protein [Clostridia bacterium]